MARDNVQHIDKTYLSADKTDERGIVHRDLLAHALRWSFALRRLKPTVPQAIMDIGCGVEAPFAKTLYVNRQTIHSYMGIDYGPIKPNIKFAGKFQPTFMAETDATQFLASMATAVKEGHEPLAPAPDFVVSYEVFEHMLPDRLAQLLLNLRAAAAPPVDCYFSTPVYNHQVGAAANHLNEMTRATLGAILESAGYAVVKTYGTFASQSDYKDELLTKYGEVGKQIFEELHEYYDSNLVSILWAPLFPKQSRNNLWHCRLKSAVPGYQDKFGRAVLFSQDPARRGQCQDDPVWQAACDLLGVRDRRLS